jgi:hypothetical protein
MGQKRVVSRKPPTPDIGKNAAKVNFVRIADLWDYNSEWLLRAHSHKCCAVANDRFADVGK